MNERDELAGIIHRKHCLERVHSADCMFWFEDHESADAVIAAGWEPRRG